METYTYQKCFSENHPELYNFLQREQKAKKIIAVLKDFVKDDLSKLRLLDIGSSTGIMTNFLSSHFYETTGVDIDEKGIIFSSENFRKDNLNFKVDDAMNLSFSENSFDIVNCSHIYEHVPDSKRLMDEIYRVLKPGGVCYFAAGNRLVLIEAHYKLPFLSIIPKWLAHKYIKIFKKADFYYENHLTYWGLKKLVSKFEIYDYTKKIIKDPVKYFATDMIKPGSFLQYLYLVILNLAYWICPTYIWILRKK